MERKLREISEDYLAGMLSVLEGDADWKTEAKGHPPHSPEREDFLAGRAVALGQPEAAEEAGSPPDPFAPI